MKKNILLLISLLLSFNCANDILTTKASNDDGLKTVENGRFVTIKSFPSEYLSLTRDITVYLPQSYSSNDSVTYPVIYMHDGQNIFSPGGPYGCWYVENAYDSLVEKGLINEAIIVGIDNTSARMSEYTPTKDSEYGGGDGENYSKFIINELKPYIDAHYKTKSDAANTGIMGSSLGGLISFYIAWNHPEVFGMAGCVSSSFWWDNRNLLTSIESYSGAKKNIRFWIDSGTAEGSDGSDEGGDDNLDGRTYMVEDARRMAEKLASLGWTDNDDLAYFEAVGEAHNEGAWSKRVGNILYFMLRKTVPQVKAITVRPFFNVVGLTGITNTCVSLDLSCDNDFVLTKLYSGTTTGFSMNSKDTNILTFSLVNNNYYGYIAPQSVGKTKITAQYNDLTADATIEVVSSLSDTVNIVFNVTCPSTGGTNEIYMAGDGGGIPSGSEWAPDGLASDTKISDTNYKFHFTMKRYQSFSFKFTKDGTWEHEEVISSNRTFTSSVDETVNLTISGWK